MRRALITLALLGSFASSAWAEPVGKLPTASLDTWVVLMAAVVLVILVGVASFLSPRREPET